MFAMMSIIFLNLILLGIEARRCVRCSTFAPAPSRSPCSVTTLVSEDRSWGPPVSGVGCPLAWGFLRFRTCSSPAGHLQVRGDVRHPSKYEQMKKKEKKGQCLFFSLGKRRKGVSVMCHWN